MTSTSLHGPESMIANGSDGVYWLKITAEDSCEVNTFFAGPSAIVLMLHDALDSALELEQRELKEGGEDANST